jgi:hypothetical protein
MTAKSRTQDDVRREIEHEREQLVTAVEQLRSATNVKPLLRKVALGAVAAGALRAIVRRRFSAARRRSG